MCIIGNLPGGALQFGSDDYLRIFRSFVIRLSTAMGANLAGREDDLIASFAPNSLQRIPLSIQTPILCDVHRTHFLHALDFRLSISDSHIRAKNVFARLCICSQKYHVGTIKTYHKGV